MSDVEAWLTAAEAPADQRAELLDIAESVQVASIIWDRTLRGGREEHQRTIGRLLDEARDMRFFQTAVVPGLLQTAEYARRVLSLADVFGLADTARAAAARIDRQAALYEKGRRFEFLVTEAALRFRPGPAHVLGAQYDKILSLCTLPAVTVAVLPTGSDSSMVYAHPFVIYGLPDDTAFVTIETYTRELTLTDTEEVRLYQHVYQSLRADAVHGDEARHLLTSLRDEAVAAG